MYNKKRFKIVYIFFNYLFRRIFGVNFLLDKHNNVSIENYPEKSWFLIPFPFQKGIPFNSDNLATVNRYNFIHNSRFKNSIVIAEKRWKTNNEDSVRDISWRFHVALWSISQALKNIKSENEIFVECGTGRGYMAAGIIDYFKWDNDKPHFYLIDSFKSTMPNEDGSQTKDGNKLFVYADGDKEVREYFSNYSKIKIITGFIPTVLVDLPQDAKIKFLHLDLNSSVAEESALDSLKNNFIDGTIILFDDYGGPGGENQARIHEEFAEKNNKFLLALPTGQALIIW